MSESDWDYWSKQGKKALEFVRKQPKNKKGKLKNRKIADATSMLLRGFRAKDTKLINKACDIIFTEADNV